ncbi:MAG TPA: class I SAM-dependent methyltransferase [Chloroflexota bacterium]
MRNLVYDVQRYYRLVAPFLSAELAQRGDAALWRELGQAHAGGSILEIGCGCGRVTELLAQAVGWVVGIDLSPELLAQAQHRLAGSQTALVLADVRRLALRHQFDLIVAPDDPFSHLLTDADRQQAFSSVAAQLAPGGRFVLDALWFPPNRPADGVAQDITVEGRVVHLTERWRCDAVSHRCLAEFHYRDSGQATRAHFEARYWTPTELRSRLSATGLRSTAWWGSYDRQPWDEQRSQHLIVEALRPPD